MTYDRPRAHRARIIAAKRMAASNSAALAEILGIPSSSTTPTASPSPLTTATATGATTPIPTPATSCAQEDEDPLQKLTTAALSVGDYLRAKLGAKAAAQPGPKNLTAVTQTQYADRYDDDPPRAGLGAAARLVLTGPPDEPVRAASMLAVMFARGQAMAGAKEETDGASVERAETHDDEGGAGDEEDVRKSARRHAKEERHKKKEERRWRKEEAKSRAIAEPDAEPPNGASVVEPSIDEARPGRVAKRKKHRESDIQDGLSEDSPAPRDGRTVVVSNKKQKKRDKSRKTE